MSILRIMKLRCVCPSSRNVAADTRYTEELQKVTKMDSWRLIPERLWTILYWSSRQAVFGKDLSISQPTSQRQKFKESNDKLTRLQDKRITIVQGVEFLLTEAHPNSFREVVTVILTGNFWCWHCQNTRWKETSSWPCASTPYSTMQLMQS